MASAEFYVEVEILLVCLAILLICVLWSYWKQPTDATTTNVPLAKPHIPLLGNAIAYKDHPDIFLCSQAKKYGSIFRLNLAGMQTYVLSSKATLKQFALAPENMLSSKAAVSDFGFKYTLGERNVFEGTPFHRNVVKLNFSSASAVDKLSEGLVSSLEDAINLELTAASLSPHNAAAANGGSIVTEDFMMFIRRIVLRSVINVFLSKHFLAVFEHQGEDDFITHFMDFQDMVEEATASAAVLPLFLAYPLGLYQCQSKRRALTEKISKVIKKLWEDTDSGLLDSADEGVWLKAMRDSSTRDAADLVVGLLFAAHKNPAIATSQCVLFLVENHYSSRRGAPPSGSFSLLQEAIEEARQLYCERKRLTSESLDAAEAITNSCLETLRVTAHSIGAVRKVVSPVGWKVRADTPSMELNVEGEGEGEGSASTLVQREYVIPYGAYVGASHIVPHRDPEVWGESADQFDPNRPDLKTLCANDLVMTTFSHGIHKCPGSRITMMMMRLLIVVLLGKYELSVSSDQDIPPLSFKRATLAQRNGKCKVALKIVSQS